MHYVPNQPRVSIEITTVKNSLEGRNTGLAGIGPANAAEDTVAVVDMVINPSISLICIQRSGSVNEVVILRKVSGGDGLVCGRIEACDLD